MATNSVKPRYKTPSFEKFYRQLLDAAADTSSFLYRAGRPSRNSDPVQECFWHGFELTRTSWIVPGTLQSVAYQAGKAYRKIYDRSQA